MIPLRYTPVFGVALLGMVFVSGVLKGGLSGARGIACGVGAACLKGLEAVCLQQLSCLFRKFLT